MATIKGFTDKSQSKKLEFILPRESADMHYIDDHYNISEVEDGFSMYWYNEYQNDDKRDYIPCWSLSALLEVLPKIHGLKPILDLEECSIQYSGIDIYVTASNLIDACVETILKLHEQNLI